MKHHLLRRITAGCLSALMLVMSPISTLAEADADIAFVAGEASKSGAVATASEVTPSQVEKAEKAFEQSKEVNGVIVTVTADPGVFPEDAKLSVKIVSKKDELEEVDAAVAKEEPGNIADQYVFDISVLKDGVEIEPDNTKGTVQVSFALAEVHDTNSELEVYHVTEENGELKAESLEVQEETIDNVGNLKRDEETVVKVETDGFSVYVVAFTYGDLSYTFGETHQAKVSEIMEATGLTGEVEDVKISNGEALSIEKDQNEADWTLKENKEFEDEKLTLTINGKGYDVILQDGYTSPIYYYVDPSTSTLHITNDIGVTWEPDSGTIYGDRKYTNSPWVTLNSYTKVVVDGNYGKVSPDYIDYWFRGKGSLVSVDLTGLDTSKLTDLSYLFADCGNLKQIVWGDPDTSNVTKMSSMFNSCYNLTSIDVSKLETEKVTDMNRMFVFCRSLTSIDVSGFCFANVTSTDCMFAYTYALKKLDLSNFTTLQQVDVYEMLYYSAIEELDLRGANSGLWKNSPFGCNNKLSKVTLGPDWNNTSSHYLPRQSSSNIPGADGLWHTADGYNYDPSDVTTNGKVVTFYAVCVNYTIKFNANGGTGSYADQRVTSMTEVALPANSFSRKGYTLTGWKDNFGRTYSKNQTVSNLTTSKGAVITMYAQWTPIRYYITFNANGGSGSMSTKTAVYDTTFTLPANTLKKTNFVFIGWNTKADGKGTSYKDKASFINLTDISGKTITLYAIWGYKITYQLNGGTNNSKNPSTMKPGASFTLQKPTKTGYTFGGWYTNSSFTKKITALNSSTVKKNITLYAKWTANKYTIKFNANGGKGSMASVSATYGKSVTLKANTFTRSGYTFTGWATNKNGSGKTFANKASVKNLTTTNNATITLYAQWQKPFTTTVTFKSLAKEKYYSNKLTYSVSGSCTGVEIWRSTNSSSGFTLIGTTTNKTTYSDSSAVAGRKYYYKLRAYKTSGSKKIVGQKYSAVKNVQTALKPNMGGSVFLVYDTYVLLKVSNGGSKPLYIGGSESGKNLGLFYPFGSGYVKAYLYDYNLTKKLAKYQLNAGYYTYVKYKYESRVSYYNSNTCAMAFFVEYDGCSYTCACDYYGNGSYKTPLGEEGVKLDSSNCIMKLDGIEYTPDFDEEELKEQ